MPQFPQRSRLRVPRKALPVSVVLAAAVLTNLLSPGIGLALDVRSPQPWLDATVVGVAAPELLDLRAQSVGGGLVAQLADASQDVRSSAVPAARNAPELTLAADTAAAVSGDPPAALPAESQQLRDDSRRLQAEMVDLRQRLAASEAANHWLPWLFLGLMGALAGLLWSGLRLHRLRREHAQRKWSAAAAEMSASLRPDGQASTPAPLFTPDLRGPPAAALPAAATTFLDNTLGAVSRSAVAASGAAAGRPVASGVGLFGSDVPPRPVSVEELLDLEQQVDFFMVLGQQQEAIDLLLGHVRATGGASALPYFKLLEIYRRQDDEEAYERTRERFNLRFNAAAPDWHGDLAAGRQLDSYPDVIQRLQLAWSNPLCAAAELESLLLRRADLEPFDLPAFHDVLTLHALVHDMPTSSGPAVDREAPAAAIQPVEAVAGSAVPAAPGKVDLLLPLGDAGMPPTGRQRGGAPVVATAMLAEWVYSRSVAPLASGTGLAGSASGAVSRPAKLDLDLSDFAPAPREFTRPAAFTDVDMRRDDRLSDLAQFDDSDLLPPSISRR